ncbi:MAG: hypothetical protein OXG08_03820 [Gammaproteobacteria bacterium]|nr:hypothetical protein [Gammaproteobacteria bacterium]
MKSVKLSLPVFIAFFLVSFGLGAFSYWAGISLFSANNYVASKDGKSAQSLTNYGQQAGSESNNDTADGRQSRVDKFGNKCDATEHVVEETHGNSIENPREAWHELVQQSRGSIGNVGKLIDIADAWVRKDGLNVLQEISAAGLLEEDVKWIVLGSTVHEAAKREPEQTFEHVLSMEGHARTSFTLSAALVWAVSDPLAALNAIDGIGDTSLRVRLLEHVLYDVAQRDPSQLSANLQGFPESLREIAREQLVMGTASNNPQEAVRLLEALNVGIADNRVAESIVDHWKKSDPFAALDWVLNSPILEGKRRDLAARAINRVVGEEPDLAMKLALEQPAEWGLESDVISTLAYSDAFAAMQLLPQIRDPQGSFPYDAIGYGLIQQGHSKSVLDLAGQVPEKQRNAFYSNMMSNWAHLDPLGLLNAIEELPTPEVKSKAAYSLVSQYFAIGTLTDEQIESAKEFLSDWDRQRLDGTQTHFRFIGASQEMRFAGTPDQVRFLMDELEKLIEEVESDDPSD